MNWKDKINELALKGLISYGTEKELQNFISTEIIEKILEDNKTMNHEQLKDKWLS